MTRRCKQNSRPQKSDIPVESRVTGWKLWRVRLFALIAVPLLFFAVVELTLRLAGFGYPTSFLLPSTNHVQETFVQNNQFGCRIFVFGESAAYGDPQPRFGLPRMIEALLGLHHPGVKSEVVNVAMTGINSHVIVPIAREWNDDMR